MNRPEQAGLSHSPEPIRHCSRPRNTRPSPPIRINNAPSGLTVPVTSRIPPGPVKRPKIRPSETV